ncbi:MAG: acyltransferase family protein [Acutalibacteraceae bacterium]
MQELAKRQNFNSIDLVKFIASIFVIGIHTQISSVIQIDFFKNFVDSIFEFAVPFFFVSSGFLLYKFSSSYENLTKRAGRTALKFAKIYLLLTALYMPLTVIGYYTNGLSAIKAAIDFVLTFLFAGENYYSWQLWYLLAAAVGMALIYLLLKMKLKVEHIFAFSAVMFVLGNVLLYLHSGGADIAVVELYFKIFLRTQNGLFVGMFWLSLGLLIAKCQDKIKTTVYAVSFAAGTVGIVIDAVHSLSCFKNAFLVLFCFGVFGLVLRMKIPKSNTVSKKLRELSTLIYYVHMYFVALFRLVIFRSQGDEYNCILLFVCVFALSLAASWAYLSIKAKIHLKHGKKIGPVKNC